GGYPANDFLMSVVRHGEVKGGLSQLDGEDIEKAGEHPRKIKEERGMVLRNFRNLKASGHLVHADSDENNHGFISHHLDQFALSANVAVRRAHTKCTQNKKCSCQGQAEDSQQDIG